ncbi:hypothetical protein RJ640_004773, partial [Escallonia rubra]
MALMIADLSFNAQGLVKRETRFTSKCPANVIILKLEEAAQPLGYDVKKNNYKAAKTWYTALDFLIKPYDLPAIQVLASK